MRRKPPPRLLAFILVLLLLGMSWTLGPGPAAGYAPIDSLINQVDQLRQAGQIFDITTAANLIVSLRSIGSLIDGGDKVTAGQLLTAFTQEVSSLSGVLMTATAATQLVDEATHIAAGL